MPSYDTDLIRAAANGNWAQILESAGIACDYLTGEHTPCPKCGGKDRFRFTDRDGDGSAICTGGQGGCVDVKPGNGTEVLYWWKGWTQKDFPEACKLICDALGIDGFKKKKASGKYKKKTLKEEVIPNGEWNDSIWASFLGYNPGLTKEGVLSVEAFVAKHRSQSVIAIPIWNEKIKRGNAVLMGWVSENISQYDKNGNVVKKIRRKVVMPGTGFICSEEEMKILLAEGMCDLVIKVEGITDCIALRSILLQLDLKIRVIVVSNCNGAGENPGWMAKALANAKQCWVIGDADDPGAKGALKWARAVAAVAGDDRVKVIPLPYDMETEKGKDLRDFCRQYEGRSFAELENIAKNAPAIEGSLVVDSNEPGTTNEIPEDMKEDLSKVGIQVVGMDANTNKVLLFSEWTGNQQSYDLNKLARNNLIQLCGVRAHMVIEHEGDDSGGSQPTMPGLKVAIASTASLRLIELGETRSSGVWRQGKELVICNKGGLSILREDGCLVEHPGPIYDDEVYNVNVTKWFEHDDLAARIEMAKDPAWCNSVVRSLFDRIDGWRFGREADVLTLTGLVMASLVQQVWDWRPQVSIRGESGVGKTQFLKFLFGEHGNDCGVLGKEASCHALPTPAGLRQDVGMTSHGLGIDEWDSLPPGQRASMLKLIRTAGPASTVTQGTTSQKAMKFGLSHVAWVSGIHVGMEDLADQNRFLTFNMDKKRADVRAKWKMATEEECSALYFDLLAVSLRYAREAASLADDARLLVQVPEVNERVVQGSCVPAAILAAAQGGGLTQTVALAASFVGGMLAADAEEMAMESSAHELLGDILSIVFKLGQTDLSVRQVVSDTAGFVDSHPKAEDQMATTVGVKKFYRRSTSTTVLGIYSKKTVKHLDGEINAKGVMQILKRIEGAVATNMKLPGGGQAKSVLIPWDAVKEMFFSCEDDEADPDPYDPVGANGQGSLDL